METQRIDAIALIRQIRDAHYQHLRDKTHEERIAFYRKQARRMQGKLSDLLVDKSSVVTLEDQILNELSQMPSR